MKNDIQLEMNTRKTDTREEQKTLEIRIQEVNNRLTIALGDLRTEMEGMKWEMTRRSLRMCWFVGELVIYQVPTTYASSVFCQ